MKIPRFVYMLLFIISEIIALSTLYTHFIIKIIAFKEMLEIMIISGGIGILLLIFSKNNPLDQLLAGKKIVIESKKILAVAAISTILGAIALCGGLFLDQRPQDRLPAIIFGITFIIFGVIGLIQIIFKNKGDNGSQQSTK